MAWLEQKETGQFHIAFRFGEERFKKSLRTKDKDTAEARLHRVEENIRLVEAGRLKIPDTGDVGMFLLSDGQLNGKPYWSRTWYSMVEWVGNKEWPRQAGAGRNTSGKVEARRDHLSRRAMLVEV